MNDTLHTHTTVIQLSVLPVPRK